MYPLPSDLSALESVVVSAAALHEEMSARCSRDFSRFFHLADFDPDYPDLSVKYSGYRPMDAEHLTLQYVYSLACKDGDAAPHVPQPVHYFKSSNYLGYMIMRRIYTRVVSDEELHKKTAQAVLWLRSKSPPPGTLFGSMGKYYAFHPVFKDGIAPQKFTSVAAAERFLNTAVEILNRRLKSLADISLVNDDIVLTQSDMHACNFGVALDGRPVIFGFATIQALPTTLANDSLLGTAFAAAVSQYVFDPAERAAFLQSTNRKSLSKVGYLLMMSASPCLGVDENGIHQPRVQARVS